MAIYSHESNNQDPCIWMQDNCGSIPSLGNWDFSLQAPCFRYQTLVTYRNSFLLTDLASDVDTGPEADWPEIVG